MVCSGRMMNLRGISCLLLMYFSSKCSIVIMLFTDAPIDAPWDVIVQSYMDVMGWSREYAEEYVDVLAGIGMWEPCDRKEKYKDATPPPPSCPLW